MKIKAFLRVARHKTGNDYQVAANKRVPAVPLEHRGEPLPTVTLPLELDVPDFLLRPNTAEPIQIDLSGITELKGRIHVIVPDEFTDEDGRA